MTKSKTIKVEPIALTTNWPVGPVNVYLIYGEKLTLVDTGLKNETTWRELNSSLNQKGMTIQDLEQIVITHHHNDHAGMLDWILQENSIPVYAHHFAKPYLERDRKYLKWSETFFRQLYYEFGLPEELLGNIPRKRRKEKIDSFDLNIVSEGEEIPYLNGWKVIETKGHSQDHISLVHENSQTMICGDHLIKGMPAGIFIDAPFEKHERAKPLLQYVSSLETCLSLNLTKAYSGHGPVIYNVKEVIHEQLRRIENRAKRLKNILANESLTGFEIIQAMYPKRYKSSIGLFVSETLSLLDLLCERGEITVSKRNGIYEYRQP